MRTRRKPVNASRAQSPRRQCCDDWKLLVIDSAPIRKKARRAYEKVLRDLDAAKVVSERFQTQDQPLYAKWLHANFGALLTELGELQNELSLSQQLVQEVQAEFCYGRYRSIHDAYRKVIARRAQPVPSEEEERETEADEWYRQEEKRREQFEDEFRKIAEEFWARLGLGPENRGGDGGDHPRRARNANASRLKDIYRKLARRLHPDKAKRVTPKEVEWWHQAQAAYEAGDLDQLEMILTLVEMEKNGTREATVSILAQLTAEFKRTLRNLKRQITQFRKDVAWNFSQLTDRSAIFQRVRLELERDRENLRFLLQRCEAQIAQWQAAAQAPRKRVRSRRTNWAEEEWF